MTEWNEALEKKILKKSRFVLTVRILRILMIGVLLYGAYMIALAFITDELHVAEENDYYTKLALDWTVPNVRGAFGFEEEEISPLGTSAFSYPLIRTVGKKEMVVGEAQVTKRLANSLSSIEYQTPSRDELDRFFFFYPEDPRNGNSLKAYGQPDVWGTLDKLHEGTVAEVAFSTDRFMTPEELIAQLEPYDIDVLWMPLHTGEFETFTPEGWGGGVDDFRSFSSIYRLDSETIQDSQQMMVANMETLLEEKSASYYERFLGLSYLNERYEYMEENGFMVYGAVVTGPVKELLKLEEEAMVAGEQLGQVELWNWEEE